MPDLRCPTRLHARLTDTGLIEIKCRNNGDPCGASAEVTVMHYFDPISGELVETKKFRNANVLFDKDKKKEKV